MWILDLKHSTFTTFIPIPARIPIPILGSYSFTALPQYIYYTYLAKKVFGGREENIFQLFSQSVGIEFLEMGCRHWPFIYSFIRVLRPINI